jgi:AraC-like DNA-binding protein
VRGYTWDAEPYEPSTVPQESAFQRPSSRLALVAEGYLRMAPILGLPQLLADAGLDPNQVITAAGLDPNLFDDAENTIAFADLGRLLALCAARTECPHLGLLVGQRTGLDALGVVGRLAACCADVGCALQSIILYLHLHDRGAVPSFWVSGDRAVLAYTIFQPDVPGIDQIYDGAVAISYNLLQQLIGPGWEAEEVRLHRPQPADVEPYRRHYNTRISFGAEHAAVVFASAWLARPLDRADAAAQQGLLQEIEALEARGAGDLPTQLRRVLRRMLIGGAGPGETSVAHVSRLLAIHRRTLNRQLRNHGTSLKALIAITRYEIARQMLRDTQLPIIDIAAALDYADAAAFSRAFRRWSGVSPKAWRANNGVH